MTIRKNFHWIVSTILFCLAVSFFIYLKMTEKKVGHLDFDILLSKYEGIKPAQLELEKNTRVLRGHLDTLKMEFDQSVKRFEAEQKKMSAPEKLNRKNQLDKQQQDLLHYQKVVFSKMQDEEEKTIQKFSKEIKEYLEEYSQKNNYTLVFFHRNEVVAYSEKENDITYAILEGLNEQYRKTKR